MPAALNPDALLAPLPADTYKRYDESPDEIFYEIPHLVTHIDDAAIEAVTQVYREFLPAGHDSDIFGCSFTPA